MIVLRYVHNTASWFHIFVANRLRLIQLLNNTKQWQYVSKKCNPADVAFRGLIPTKFTLPTYGLKDPNFYSMALSTGLKNLNSTRYTHLTMKK